MPSGLTFFFNPSIFRIRSKSIGRLSNLSAITGGEGWLAPADCSLSIAELTDNLSSGGKPTLPNLSLLRVPVGTQIGPSHSL